MIHSMFNTTYVMYISIVIHKSYCFTFTGCKNLEYKVFYIGALTYSQHMINFVLYFIVLCHFGSAFSAVTYNLFYSFCFSKNIMLETKSYCWSQGVQRSKRTTPHPPKHTPSRRTHPPLYLRIKLNLNLYIYV